MLIAGASYAFGGFVCCYVLVTGIRFLGRVVLRMHVLLWSFDVCCTYHSMEPWCVDALFVEETWGDLWKRLGEQRALPSAHSMAGTARSDEVSLQSNEVSLQIAHLLLWLKTYCLEHV